MGENSLKSFNYFCFGRSDAGSAVAGQVLAVGTPAKLCHIGDGVVAFVETRDGYSYLADGGNLFTGAGGFGLGFDKQAIGV